MCGALTVLTGDADPRTTLAEAESWRDHTDGAFRMRVFSGGHFFLTGHLNEVYAEIQTELDAARSAGP
jgi:surfactin synthase thioesterase subunit